VGSVKAGLGVALILALSAALGPWAAGAPASGCGRTTIDATVADRNADGILECEGGERVVVRTDLARAQGDRARTRRPLATLLTLADFQLPDEESPLRGEFFDKCFTQNPAKAGFRPHETVLAHMINAHVSAANRIIATGGPVLGQPIDFTFLLGDLAENQHLNEVDWVISLMQGGSLDPDTGADGYDGVQADDPSGRGDVVSPIDGTRIRDLANEPFLAVGLRRPDGSPSPWYSVMGNHDTKVQGTVPDEIPGWREFARTAALGPLKVNDLAPDRQQQACDVLINHPEDLPSFLEDLLTDAVTDPASVGTVKLVPPDPNRRLVNKQEWIDAFAQAPGLPSGHGFLPETQRCPDTYDDPFERRACYAFVRSGIHYIVLDGNPAEGLAEGNIDPSQFAWLTKLLQSSSTTYLDEEGRTVRNPNAVDRLIVIASHHPMRTFNNTGTVPGTSPNHTAEDLSALLLRFPNVILHLAGHSHENLILPQKSEMTKHAYWEVNTAAIADWPNQSRSVELSDNRDGTLSIHTVVFDGATPPDPRTIAWEADATDEPGERINEAWLAALGWETAFHDPQVSSPEERTRAQGQPRDRNAELLIRAPGFLAAAAAPPTDRRAPTGPVLPATGGAATAAVVAATVLALLLLAVRRRAT
jgi:metallophosphoesterase (TIGR03767 family)